MRLRLRPVNAVATRFGMLVLAAALSACSGGAERLTGTVLQVAGAQIMLHTEAFGSHPALSTAAEVPGTVALAPGERISADVDTTTKPWTLANVTVDAPPPALPVPVRSHRALVRPGDLAPDLAFLDQRGRPFALASLRGRPYALTFIYTHCADPHMCPLVSAKLGAMQRDFDRRGVSAQLVEVTLDPKADGPAQLARYAASYGAKSNRWHLLTGDVDAVAGFALAYGIYAEHVGGTIVHDDRLVIVGRAGRIAKVIDDAYWAPHDVERELVRG